MVGKQQKSNTLRSVSEVQLFLLILRKNYAYFVGIPLVLVLFLMGSRLRAGKPDAPVLFCLVLLREFKNSLVLLYSSQVSGCYINVMTETDKKKV